MFIQCSEAANVSIKSSTTAFKSMSFYNPTHAAVDEFIDHLAWIASNDPNYASATSTRILMDTCKSGALPMYYIAKRANEWTRSQSAIVQNRPARTAQLYNVSNAYVTIAKNLGKVFNSRLAKQEYFLNERDAAIAWLLKND